MYADGGDVLETGLEEQVGACGEERGGDDGHDPVYAGGGCPAEPEHGDWEQDGASHRNGQTGFWNEVYNEIISWVFLRVG